MKIVRVMDIPALTMEHDPAAWHARDWEHDAKYLELVRMTAQFCGLTTPFLFQREPNLRYHPPGGTAVPWHTDADFGHLEEEWNVWVPLTETTDDSQRLWIEGPDCWQRAVNVPLGSVLIFRGATTRHGNQLNSTDIARHSFDFRLLAKEHYRDTGAKTVLYGVPLRVPEYWTEMK